MADLKNRTTLVTGGAGFIGSHLCEELHHRGASVVALDNFDPYYPRKAKEQNLERLHGRKRFELVEADIRDHAELHSVTTRVKPDVIVHLAARAGVRPSLEDPAGYVDVNVRGWTNVLEAARVAGVRNVVFASSSSVYGLHDTDAFLETDRTDTPLSPYGATKKAGEVLGHVYHHLHGISVSCLRLFTVYGPRQRPDLAICKFVQCALEGNEIEIYGDGSSSRDYTHVRDVVGGILGAMDWGAHAEPRFGIFNLGSSRPVVLKDMIDLIEESVGKPVRRKYTEPQPGDVPHTFANSEKAARELGFRQTVPFADGLKEFVDWMRMR